MCGRFSLTRDPRDLERRFKTAPYQGELFSARFNIPPSSDVAAILTEGSVRRIENMKWGLVRQWETSKPPLFITNLKAETLARGPFKSALAERRCIIPADGFYEWTVRNGKKVPFRFTLNDGGLFGFAAIFDEPREDLGPPIRTFTLFTIASNTVVAPVHDRMPCLLPPASEDLWLNSALSNAAALDLLKPYPAEAMRGFEVSPLVNTPKNDTAECVKPVR